MSERQVVSTPEKPESNDRGIGPRLTAVREAAHMVQAELARRMGVSRSALNRWELGQRTIPAEQVAQVCEILGVEPAGILGIRNDHPLPEVNRRMLMILRAEGPQVALRRLGVNKSATDAIASKRLIIANSQLETLAKAYGVSYSWVLSGKPDFWTPPMKESWCSRLRFFRVSIGGFPDHKGFMPLREIFTAGERSEDEAKILLRSGDGGGFQAIIRTYEAYVPGWNAEWQKLFPFDLGGLSLDVPEFKTNRHVATNIQN